MAKINVEHFIFQPRHDTAANWAANNPILRAGEFGIVTDSTNEDWLKIGDGTTTWNSLTFKHGPQGIQGIQGVKGETGAKGDTGATGVKGDKGDKGNTGANGADGQDGYTPVKGTDYFTAEDIASLNIPANKALLDTYTQTEVNLSDAVSKKHSHANGDVIDGIDSTDIANWNGKSDFSGYYDDLTGKPSIPTVDATYNALSQNAQSGTAVASAIASAITTTLNTGV